MTEPDTVATTREALRTLACYVLGPARKARTGRIGLRPVDGGFGTPLFDDGTCVLVRDDRLECRPGKASSITTLRQAAELLEVPLDPDPGVGHDLPPFEPDAVLEVDASASRFIGEWFAFGAEVLARVRDVDGAFSVSEAQLWPEHFDLAVVVELANTMRANVGFSPGDRWCDQPYVYVGPHDRTGLTDPFWNVPFGALLDRSTVVASPEPGDAALAFVTEAVRLLL